MKNFKMTPEKLRIALFGAVILIIPIVTILLPKLEKSENENRMLAEFPSLINETELEEAENLGDIFANVIKWDYITEREDASFMDDFETYFADHIAGREMWVKTSNRLSEAMGKEEINGVYTADDMMMQSFREYDEKKVSSQIKAVNAFAERYPEIQMSFMLVPNAQEVYKFKYPSYAGLTSQKMFIDDCYGALENVEKIDALSYLSGRWGEYIYYRTDHHWTSLGAYYAYCAAAKTLGYSAYPKTAFNVETVCSDFRGTLYSKNLNDAVTPDSIDYYHLAQNAPSIKMTRKTGSEEEVSDSLYVREFLETKDKYSSFTGSNAPIVDIETDVNNGKKLLIIKDSYAHALVPFLANHYSKITMVDMRYINASLNMFMNVADYDRVLFVQNVITFSEQNYLTKLAATRPDDGFGEQ